MIQKELGVFKQFSIKNNIKNKKLIVGGFWTAKQRFVFNNSAGQNIYKSRHYKILSIEKLLTNVKYEFNANNKELYKNEYIIVEGDL